MAKPSPIANSPESGDLAHRGISVLRVFSQIFRVLADAGRQFLADDGWAIASHIALSLLMAMFPFLIVCTAMAAFFFGSKELADEAGRILLEAWPEQVADPIAADIRDVLGRVLAGGGNVLTFGVLFALYFASSGVESLRIGLNRAYGMPEKRPWWLMRIESIGYVIVGAVALLAFSFLVVLAPFIWGKILRYVPTLEPISDLVTFSRFTTAAIVLIISLLIVHRWLPAGRRSFADIAPGITATIVLWMISGAAFGRYLADYAFAYVTMYAGLASAMIALIFLYVCASIFIFGGELNSVVIKLRLGERTTPTEDELDPNKPPASTEEKPALP